MENKSTEKPEYLIDAVPNEEYVELDTHAIGTSAAIISICTIISRVTGFIRTWTMAFALGATFLSSSYQIANNLPNMLYELVMGGMLTTAFLPVYVSLKKKGDKLESEAYASNLMSIVIVGLGIVSLLCVFFPSQVIYTQSFYSNQSDMGIATLFFQFFAIQIVFYGASSILSGILNANRDYIWGAMAPIFNNIIVIASFILYAIVAPISETIALYIIAVGSPLGVFIQLVIQLPGLKRNDIRFKFHINLRDKAIRETIGLGLPALFITVCGFFTVSIANAASYSFADNGPSVIAYSRLWFTFPYSFLVVPIATTLFTELSSLVAEENSRGVTKAIIQGTSQIFFLMIPFAIYLVVFSYPLVTLYHIGAFDSDSIAQIAMYLSVLALALPFYGVNTFLQMTFASVRHMVVFSVVTLIGSLSQIAIMIIAVNLKAASFQVVSINWIAAATICAYLLGDILSLAYLRKEYSKYGMKFSPILRSILRGVILGLAGGAVGFGIYSLLSTFVMPVNNNVLTAFIYLVIAGIFALFVTFGPAVAYNFPEASFVTSVIEKIKKKWAA